MTKDSWVYNINKVPKIQQFSQSGEEGYLEYILDWIHTYHLPDNRFLVDIGAWDGAHLSNTKYFIDKLGYEGLLIDGDNRGNEKVKQEWITKDNVCDILRKYNCPKEFTLLSYDTDGNDFDILLALSKEFRPEVIICEINGTIPLGISKKIKYNENHTWNNDDYYGFSFSAGLKLAELMDYKAVFQNDSLNLYMVRKDLFENPEIIIDIPFEHQQYHPHNTTGLWEII